MVEKEPNFIESIWEFLSKIFLPFFVGISIKVAIQIKREKMKLSRVLISFVAGLGCCYFVYTFIREDLDKPYVPFLIGMVAMSGEKIAEYVIYKWDVDRLFGAFLNFVISQLKPKK